MENNYNNKLQIEANIVKELKTIFDPEIPVNIYELGLIYEINVSDDFNVNIVMTLTTPNCPVADELPIEVETKIKNIEGIKDVDVKLVFDPPWDQNMLSEEAKLDLGLL